MIENRNKILNAAARVYAIHGWRGATTRRIAEEAGVNEVTLFRQFGSKEALLGAAMNECARFECHKSLPAVPTEPQRELVEWASAHHDNLCRMRVFVRQLMSEVEERPAASGCAAHGPSAAAAQLRDYVVTLRRNGWLELERERVGPTDPGDVTAAVTMLLGALFADAMSRDMMPELYPLNPEQSVASYVRLFLRGLGVRYAPVPTDLSDSR
jgi:AcrR family transcriptional regulator